MRIAFTLCLSVAIAASSGCAHVSLTENQCLAGDWETVGLRDGQQGYDQTRLLAHQEACGKHHVVPVREAWVEGWRQGVAAYCRADNGYELGRRGNGYSDICPAESRESFLDAHAAGHRLFVARSDVQRLESTLDRRRSRLRYIDARVVELAAAQVAPDLPVERRVALYEQTRDLLDEKRDIERELPLLEQELSLAAQRLEDVQRSG